MLEEVHILKQKVCTFTPLFLFSGKNNDVVIPNKFPMKEELLNQFQAEKATKERDDILKRVGFLVFFLCRFVADGVGGQKS